MKIVFTTEDEFISIVFPNHHISYDLLEIILLTMYLKIRLYPANKARNTIKKTCDLQVFREAYSRLYEIHNYT